LAARDMDARAKAGFILVYGAWVPMIVWQSSPKWGPRVLGELRYEALTATPAADVINWVWFLGAFGAGFYLLFDMTILARLWERLRRKFGVPGERRGD
jgi:hypothetical protein